MKSIKHLLEKYNALNMVGIVAAAALGQLLVKLV
jgi:hypothetical protein